MHEAGSFKYQPIPANGFRRELEMDFIIDALKRILIVRAIVIN